MAVMYILFLFAGVAYLFVIRQIVGGVVMLLFALLYTWFLWSCRHRIPFAKFMLKTVTAVISQVIIMSE